MPKEGNIPGDYLIVYRQKASNKVSGEMTEMNIMEKTISIVLAQDFHPAPGGVSVYTENLVKNWSGNLIMIAPRRKESFSEGFGPHIKIRRIDMDLRRGKVWLIIKRQFAMLKECYRIIKSEKVSLVNCMHVASGVTALCVKWIFGIPYVLYTYGSEITAPSNIFFKILMKVILQNALYITTMSNFTRKALNAYGIDNEKITFLVGVEVEQLSKTGDIALTKEKYKISGKPVLLTVARLKPHKGIDTVIKALPKIIRKFPDIQYVVVGEGPYKEGLQKLIRTLKLEQHVRLIGNITHEKLQTKTEAFYSVCDLFLMISRNIDGVEAEGFGLVFLEAGLSRKASIGGKSGGIEDAIIDGVTGKLVDPYDIEAVSDCIITLIKSPEVLIQMGENGFERAKKHFGWRNNVAQWQDKINRVLRSP